MDDEKFKKELLGRLDKIISLLSISCAVSNGSVEKAKAEMAIRQVMASRQESTQASPSLVNNEMDEIYEQAMQKWQTEKKA